MTDPTCSTPTCLTERQVTEAVLSTKMNVIVGLSGVAVCLLAYSVLWQAPDIRSDVAKEIAILKQQDQDQIHRIQSIEKEVDALGRKVTLLIEK